MYIIHKKTNTNIKKHNTQNTHADIKSYSFQEQKRDGDLTSSRCKMQDKFMK